MENKHSFPFSMEKRNYKDKKVLIFGLGINQGGVGATKFFAQQGAKVKVTDLKTEDQLSVSLDQLKDFKDIEYTLGEHKNEDIDWADLIIKNPGVKPNNPYIDYAHEKGKQVEMDMGILLEYISPQQIIGITGTKGKSTTASLIYEALKTAGKEVIFAGNIGVSVLDIIPHLKPNSLVVLELSSFQLEAFKDHQVSPKWAVLTNIYPDHLNFYQDMDEYIKAKKWIAEFQTEKDYLVLKRNDEVTTKSEFLNGLKANIFYFSEADLPSDFKSTLEGEHNKQNMAAALAVIKTLGVDEKSALEVFKNFKGVEYRLQFIKEWKGIKFINDSASTDPNATIEAIKTYPNSIVIVGGVNKNLPYQDLAQVLDKYTKRVVFLEGDATDEIKKYLKEAKLGGTYNDIPHLLKNILIYVQSGDTILFSPGAASFNLFQNEFDRGRIFNQAVENLSA